MRSMRAPSRVAAHMRPTPARSSPKGVPFGATCFLLHRNPRICAARSSQFVFAGQRISFHGGAPSPVPRNRAAGPRIVARNRSPRFTGHRFMNQVVRTYKGFEIHPLVYPRRPADGQTNRNPDAGYEASVAHLPRWRQSGSRRARIPSSASVAVRRERARPASRAWRTPNN